MEGRRGDGKEETDRHLTGKKSKSAPRNPEVVSRDFALRLVQHDVRGTGRLKHKLLPQEKQRTKMCFNRTIYNNVQ